jgi:hypothetical protein
MSSSEKEPLSLSTKRINADPSTTDNDTTGPLEESSRYDGSFQTKKRKRPFGGSLSAAYSTVSSFTARPSTGRPDSPHFFFKSSMAVSFNHISKDDDNHDIQIPQVVHQHVNGLCIVTVADSYTLRVPPSSKVESIRFVVQEAPTCSAAEKRKKQAKMLKGGTVVGAVMPATVIAELTIVTMEETDDEKVNDTPIASRHTSSVTKRTTIVPLYACVWGTILELNHRLTPELLRDDPLLDGYLAVILPSGRFPPHLPTNSEQSDGNNNHVVKDQTVSSEEVQNMASFNPLAFVASGNDQVS